MPITFLDEEEEQIAPVTPTKRRITFLDEEEADVAPVTPQAAQPAVTQPSPYKYDPNRFRPKGLVAPKVEQEVGTLEGIANAARNAFDSSRQALDIVGDVTPEEAQNIAKIEFDKQSRKVAPGYDEYQKAEGFDAVLAFAKNPIEVTSNIVAEGLAGSLPALGAGLAAGGVGAAAGSVVPVVGTGVGFTAGQVAGTFAGSLATEYGSKILEEMQSEGVDLTKPESIQGFFENEDAVAKARDKAISRGIPVAAFDAISAGIGGKLGRVIGKQFLTKTGEAAAELGVQAGLGGGGEVAGALAAGEPIEGKAVFAEVIGEAGPGAAEIITGRMADRAARVKAEENAKIKAAAELSDNLEQNDAPLTAAAVKSTTAATIEQDKLAAQLEEQLDADEIASQVSGQLAVTKEPTAAPPAIKSKEEFAAIYSQVAPEELDAAEAGFTEQAATAETEEGRINAQNALEAIREIKATVTPPAPPVAPTITPEVTPAVPTAQPPITDATQEIIQPEGVREEPQDRVEGETPAETIARNRIFGAARGQEEGQVAPTPTAEEPLVVQPAAPEPTISEIPPTSELVGAEPTQPTIREVPEISPIVGSEPAAIVEQEPSKVYDETQTRIRGIQAPPAGGEIVLEPEPLANQGGITKQEKQVGRGAGDREKQRGDAGVAGQALPRTIPELTEDQAETLRDFISLRKSQGREPNPEQVKRLAEYDARNAGVEVQQGDIVSNIVVGHPLFEAPQPELQNLVPIKVQNKEQLASSIQRTENVRNAAQTYIGQYQADQAKAKTAAQKKAFAKKFNKSELDRQRDILDYINNDVMPELDRMEKAAPSAPAPAPVTTPPVTEVVTPAPEAAPTPAGISVGNRIKLGKSPQTYTVEEVIPQSATERELGEQYYSVKNERTGETQVVEARDLRQVKGKGARKMAAATRNEEYMRLAQDPEANRDQLQRMVDEAAKAAGYDIRGYHGTRSPIGFTEFIPNEALGGAIFVATEPSEASAFGRVMDVFIRAKNIRKGVVRSYDEVRAIASSKKRGQDAIRVTDGVGAPINYAVFDPIQIKSADPVTYDDAGNIIPLEERFLPTSPDIRRQAIDTTPEGILITPLDQRYAFKEVFDVAYDMFGGKIPEGFAIVNDSTNKDFEFKAAYVPESGEIIVNLAYLNKNDDIRDAITHELGHYIYGDPEFRAAFDQFIASLSPEARAELDAYVDTAYNKETGEVRLEEKMVRAFVDQFINEEQAPMWRTMLDAIKRFLNKLGFKFNISDRDAISVFTAALDRYKAEEFIPQKGAIRRVSEMSKMDADYLAAVERGDMETAQRMVDEAAKKAGYEIGPVYHGTKTKFTEFDKRKIKGRHDLSFGFHFTSRLGEAVVYATDLERAHTFLRNGGDIPLARNEVVLRSYIKADKPLVRDTDYNSASMDADLRRPEIVAAIQNAEEAGNPFDSVIINRARGDEWDHQNVIVFNPEQIKSADPVTYDDAGNVIPLSQRFRPTSPDIRRMAAEPAEATPADEARREEFAGMQVGRIVTTPPGIKQKTTDIIRAKFFDSTKVSPESTSQAWAYISQFMDKADNSNNKFAGYVNNVTELELPEADRRGIDESIGAVMLQVELANYAGRLATQGDTKMLSYIIRNGNRMPTGEYAQGIRKAGKDLNAVKERLKDQAAGFAAFNAELKSNVERLASTLFGTKNPNEDQIAIAKQALTDSDNIELGDANQVAADIKEIEGRTKTNLIDKVDAKISKAIDKSGRIKDLEKKATRVRSIESQAESIIESLQRSLGELPPLPQKRESDIRTIVKQDLRQNPDMGRREPWNNMLVARLMQVGVSEEQAQMIADLTWRQHEQKDINRELKELRKAAEEGSLAVIIDRIKNTPLEKQQSPEWKKDVIMEYLREAGLSTKAAETAANLYDSVISERLAAAKQKAFEATLAKAAPWKDYASRNSKLAKDALKKVQDAIRTGVLDPNQTAESIIAAQNGWTGFTKDQYQRIVELDTILNDPKQDDVTKMEAVSELNKIITAAKLPAKFKEAIADYYVGQALLGIPTFSVNIASPAGFSIRNILTDIAKYAFTDPKRIPIAFESLLDSMRSWYGNVSYSFRTEVYPNDVVEYLQGGDALKEIFNRGKKQWAEGKYAEGFTNMAVGMAHITKKVLSALDQGAISMIENQNLTRYAMEALSAQKKIPKDQIRAFGQSILAIRNQSIAQSISEGMPRDRAIVLADLAAKSELIYSLSRYEISPDEVLDSAINDALQSVGRNRKITIKGIEESDKAISDTGTLTYLPIRFLEMIAEKSMQSGPAMQVFSKMVYGFALIPARVFSNVAWFSPVGAYRFAVDAFAKSQGWKSPYAMSLGTGLQYRQRLTETIAGSIVMLGLAALRSDSTEDDEDKKFKIVITGNGPNAVTDKQYYDSWMKKWKPYSIHIVVDGTIIPINIGRGGEALFFPIMLAGALDDLAIKKKQNLTKKEPEDLVSAVEVLGSSFFALAQRGPYAAFTKPLFDASKQGRVTEELASQAGYFGKTFIPVLGTSIARNITDFISDPVDRSSIEGAIYANTPVVGPWLGTKALNALGQPIRADDWGDKLFKLGVPVVFSFPKNTPENALNELILKQGGGPTIPTRSNAQKRFGDILTDKEFETYVREYGRVMSDKMFKNRTRLANMKPADYDDELEKYARGYSIDGIKIKGASDSAVLAVKRMRQ